MLHGALLRAEAYVPVCADDPDLWFSESKADIAFAKECCQTCPLIASCHKAGRGEEYGIWGGVRVDGAISAEQVRLEDQSSRIVALTAQGLSGRVVAERLNVTRRTVVRTLAAARLSA